jgi:hypothetical protein
VKPLRAIAMICLASCALVGNANSQSSSQSVRQTWEYKTVTLEQGVDPNNQFARGVRILEDGQPISTPPTVRERANQLGMHGWELVSVAATENTTYRVHVYWFKRPRP